MNKEKIISTEEIINNAVSIINGSVAKYRDSKYERYLFYKVYPFTTENIEGYMKSFNLKGQKVLTVGSSGDQVLNYILKEATEITVYDINIYAELYYNLKKAAILSLDYHEFFDFFILSDYPSEFKTNYKAFDYELYKKVSEYLNEETKYFWDKMYTCLSGFKIRHNMFSHDVEYYEHLKEMTGYLKNEETYYVLRDKLKDVEPKFIVGNIIDFKNFSFEHKFDFINLSNIAQYLEKLFKKNHLQKFKNILKTLDSNILNMDGKIIVSYLYWPEERSEYTAKWGKIYDLENVFKVFKEYDLKLSKFPGVDAIRKKNDNIYDMILLYTKQF